MIPQFDSLRRSLVGARGSLFGVRSPARTPNRSSPAPVRSFLGALLILFLAAASPAANAVTLTQIISREHPSFDVAGSHLAMGKDGLVYLSSDAYILRISRDGTQKLGSTITRATWMSAANQAGIMASANAHFIHSVSLYGRDFAPLGAVSDFLNNDQLEWFGPDDVEAGATDFYGMDQNRNRIVRVAPPGREVTTYSLAPTGEDYAHKLVRFRVWEQGQRFYIANQAGELHCLTFDGKKAWTLAAGTGGNPWDGYAAAFDVDDSGKLYTIARDAATIKTFDADGKTAGDLTLQVGDRKGVITDLRVFQNDILVKRRDPICLFEVYDRATGVLRRVVNADAEQLNVTYPTSTWTAGQPVPLTIDFNAGSRTIRPHWRLWIRPYTTVDFQELAVQNGQVTPPAGAAGLYQLRVSPGVQGSSAEYTVQDMVEIRQPGTKGSVSVGTPGSRVYYGRGEEITVAAVVRAAPADLPKEVRLQLLQGDRVIAVGTSALLPDKTVKWVLSGGLTGSLTPGHYVLTATAPDLSPVPQPITLGPGFGVGTPLFHFIEYGDYGATHPQGEIWDEPEILSGHLSRSRKLGVNLFVDRLNDYRFAIDLKNWGGSNGTIHTLSQRLAADPLGAAPEKARPDSQGGQTLAGYGAAGIQLMGILVGMDAGLPLGTLWSNRTGDQLVGDINRVSSTLLPYPAFRGWSWVANWWPSKFGDAAATNDDEKKAYQAALKKANDTGAWDPILDKVSDVWMKMPVDAQDLFNKAFVKVQQDKFLTGRVKAASGPYRSVQVYPPVTFGNLDEVDLHYQSEQITPPGAFPHNVDYQKRPGKPAWAHPELWNDSGTGDYILPTLFSLMMRGADGVGISGTIPAWGHQPEDPRSAAGGTTSVFRSLAAITRPYGPWLTTLQKHDRVAIVVSKRMIRIDNWGKIGGAYFDHLFDAYQSCLYAHYPASFLFEEDAASNPTLLRDYRIILVVDQRVELDPGLAARLEAAKTRGAVVFADETCRKEDVTRFRPLELSFDRVATDPSAWQDDSAYTRFPVYFEEAARVLDKAFSSVAPPAAAVVNPEVWISERSAGKARFLWVLNNTSTGLDPGHIWRVSLAMATRVPIVADVRLPKGTANVYDVFGMKPASFANGVIQADLRTLPARLYAILPAPIMRVAIDGPRSVSAGDLLQWWVGVEGPDGKPIEASLPVRVRLLSSAGDVIDETFTEAGHSLLRLTGFKVPRMTPASSVTLEVTDLIAGKQARLKIPVRPAKWPVVIPNPPVQVAYKIDQIAASASGSERGSDLIPAEASFGPHVRDLVVSQDGSTAFLSTMNLDHNLYGIDLATGVVRWRQRVGDFLTYAPLTFGQGAAVQGYDLNAAEGYHLFLVGKDGSLSRRFALYGLPKRMTSWCTAAGLDDADNHFAASPVGDWVATSGDLGLAVWDRAGKLLWSKDWWKTDRHSEILLAPDTATLVGLSGTTVTSWDAVSGNERWQIQVAQTGTILGGQASPDGKVLAIRANTDGGRVFILRDGKLVTTLITPAEAVGFNVDGSQLALVTDKQVKWYSVAEGLHWTFTGDDFLHFPRISPDGKQIVVTSELGTAYIFGADGARLCQKDVDALAVPAWIAGGDLLLATWEGRVCRLDGQYREKWRTLLSPGQPEPPVKLLAPNAIPTTRIASWGNASEQPAPLTPNLLTDTKALVSFTLQSGTDYHSQELQNPVDTLRDGKADAPDKPWLGWTTINYIDSGWSGPLQINLDTFHTRVKLTGITFVEDSAHPESWLRDVRLQSWDAARSQWIDGPMMLSNQATHTHMFDQPVAAARFRLVSTPSPGTWPAGNIRLGELVFHGEALGASHPDVVALKPLAILFDEDESDLSTFKQPGRPFIFKYDDAYSGGKCLTLTSEGSAVPSYQPPFGHAIPNWDFEIAENPQPGQYRWIQFAWKALSPKTTGMALLIGNPWPGGGFNFVAGKQDWGQGVLVTKQVSAAPPTTWQVVRADLWDLLKKPIRLQSMSLAAVGDGAEFDQIVLGRTEGDLPPAGK